MRMLIVGYCMGIRSERRLCEEVHLNLAYRWFCRLGLDGKVPDHSTFSKTGMAAFARAMRCVICLRASFSAAWRRAWSGPRGSRSMRASSPRALREGARQGRCSLQGSVSRCIRGLAEPQPGPQLGRILLAHFEIDHLISFVAKIVALAAESEPVKEISIDFSANAAVTAEIAAGATRLSRCRACSVISPERRASIRFSRTETNSSRSRRSPRDYRDPLRRARYAMARPKSSDLRRRALPASSSQ